MRHTTRKITRFILALVAVAGVAAAIWFVRGRSGEPAVVERQAATRLLGQYLSKKIAPQCVVVLANPFTQSPGRPAEIYQFQEAALAGLKAVFKERALRLEFPKLSPQAAADPSSVPIDPGTKTPLSFMIEPAAFDEAIRQHPGCRCVVSFIGVPVNLKAFESWNSPGAPQFALLLPDWRMLGGREAILAAFQSGKLAAAVIEKRGRAEQGTPALHANSAGEYLLATPENIRDLMDRHPEVFGETP